MKNPDDLPADSNDDTVEVEVETYPRLYRRPSVRMYGRIQLCPMMPAYSVSSNSLTTRANITQMMSTLAVAGAGGAAPACPPPRSPAMAPPPRRLDRRSPSDPAPWGRTFENDPRVGSRVRVSSGGSSAWVVLVEVEIWSEDRDEVTPGQETQDEA